MSQSIWGTIVPSTTSGNQLAQLLNDFKEALMSSLSGTSRPTELDPGGTWLDVSADPTWTYYMFDGTQDIALFTIDTTSGLAGSSNAASSFEIVKTSADAVGSVLSLFKKRIINNGQVLNGDYVGVIQFKGAADDLSTPVTARIRARATDNFTSTTAGTELIFEATVDATAAIVEMMRLKDGKLGVGTTDPQNTVHAHGNGIRSSYSADDTVGAKIITHKARIAGSGQVQSGDVIASSDHKSQSATTIIDVAKVEVKATENHTDAAMGSSLEYFIKKIGTTSFVSKLLIGDEIVLKELIRLTQQVDSTTTGSNQSLTPTNAVLKVTNASLASINNIVPKNDMLLYLINGTGNAITIANDAGGTAANRIITGTGATLSLSNGASLTLVYDTASTRWRIVGGSGSGGGGSQTIETTITSNISLTEDPATKNRVWLIDASAGNITVTLPAASATTIGSLFKFKRIDAGFDSNGFTVTIVRAGADTIDEGNSQTLPNQYSRLGIVGTTATAWGVF